MSEGYRSMSFTEYWTTYFPDLVEGLPPRSRVCVLDKLCCAFAQEQYAGREVVQRLVEVHEGVISLEQYVAWSMSAEGQDGAQHLVEHLAEEEYVNGSRTDSLRILGNMEYSADFDSCVRRAAAEGIITAQELVNILSCSLRNAPLPRLRDAPAGVPKLPFRRVMNADEHRCAAADDVPSRVG